MPVPGSPEWHKRVDGMMAAESRNPMGWYYLSFAEPGRFLGGVLIQARGPTLALQATHQLGINPGGQVATSGPIPEENVARIPESMRNRLVSKQEWTALDQQNGEEGRA